MAEEITYIPYGQDEISQQDLMTNLANGVEDYLGSKRWARKEKYRNAWLKAYQEIINRGLTGASNDSGVWRITHNGDDFPIETMSNLDREMYQDAAFYIQQQMARMTPKLKEEKKDEKLDTFNFSDSFNKKLLDDYYAGKKELFKDPEQGWNTQDKRDDKTGLRGIDNRRDKMIKALQSYKNSLEGKNFNFEGTSFTDINDAKNKIQAAIDALETTDNTQDDLDAFNALGLNYRAYFSNGGNDPSGYQDSNGNPLTWTEYIKIQNNNNKLKAQQEAEKLKAQKLNYWKGFKSPDFSKLNGRPLKNEESNVNYLSQLFSKGNWNGDEASQIVTAFKLAERNGQLVPLSREELAKLNPAIWKDRAKYLRKINGINSPLYYDTLNKQFKYFYSDTPQMSFQDVLNQNNPELIKQKQQGTPISKEGWNSADTADVVSMIGDLVSLGGFWANIGGTATSLTSDLYADITRGKDLGDILKGVFTNAGWGLAGMLPGAKSTKVAARAARLIPKAVMLYQSYNTVTDPEVIKSAMKFTSTEGIKTVSSKDLENLKYLFHAVTGGTNIVKSHYRAKQYRETINKQSIKTADGKTVKLSDKEIAEVNKAGRKGGQKAAQDKFKEYAKAEAAEGQFKFSENGKSKFNPTRYSSILSKFTSDNKQLKGKQVIDTEQLNNLLQEDKNRFWYHWNKGYPRFELTPFRNIFRKDFDNSKLISSASGEESSYARKPLEQKKIRETNHIEGLPDKSTARESSFNRAIMNRYRKVMEGKFSNKEMQGGKESIKIGNEDVRVYTSKDAKGNNSVFNVFVSGKSYNFKTQEEAKKFIANIVKQQKNNITSGKITKENINEIGKVLQDLKKKGWLKHGGQINSYVDTVIEDFIKNNNI